MKKIYDLIIIGGGPAGITAGIYGARQKLNTLLITKIFGGQVARKALNIENYPGFEEISGLELIQRFEKHLRKFTPLDSKHLTGQVDPVRDFKNRKKAQRGQIFNGVDIERDEVIKL
ncbi:MAG: pyridine nucleotide-disulfide oxidoreductase, partial [Candidatus Nealsonbacteria bacterium CG23_combo_of_CG06-09_8_20_14_all_36_12]